MSVGRRAVIRSRGPRAIATTWPRLSHREVAGRNLIRIIGLPGSRCLRSRRPGRITRGRLRRPLHQAVGMALGNHVIRPRPRISKTGTGLAAIALRTPITTGTGISARDSRRMQNPAQRPLSGRRRHGTAQLGQRTNRARQHAVVTVGWADASPQTRCLTVMPTRRTVPTRDTAGRSRPDRPTKLTPVCHSPPRLMERGSLARLAQVSHSPGRPMERGSLARLPQVSHSPGRPLVRRPSARLAQVCRSPARLIPVCRSPAHRLLCRCRLSERSGVGRPSLRSPLLRSRPRGYLPRRCRTTM